MKRNNYKLRTQRRENKFFKGKEIKEDNKKTNGKKGLSKYRTSEQHKGMNTLKEYIKTKEGVESDEEENNDDSSKDKSWNIGKQKKIELRDKKYNSKKEIKRVKLKRKESDSDDKKKEKDKKEQKIKKVKTMKKDDNEINQILKEKKNDKNSEEKQDKILYKEPKSKKLLYKQFSKEKDNESENKNRINKCLTADLTRKKNFAMFDKNLRGAKLYNSTKKKTSACFVVGKNLFGNDNKVKKSKKNIDFEFALKNNLKKMQFNFFSKDKFTNTEFSNSDYLQYTIDCMELILDIDIEKQTRLKNKINFNFPKPKKNKIKKKIALFDLDETLVHCTGDVKTSKEKYQHKIEIKLPGKQAVEVGINLRPYWKQTLNLIKKNYYIVIYTASHQAYADSVLDFMDPKKKYFKYRLYRNNCSLIDVDGSKFYVKDLDIFNEYYDLKDIVIIDNSVLSFAYHLHNGIPIVPYYDEDKDGSLYVVGLYLMHIFNEDDLREANKKQINLDSFLEEAKKNKEEEYIDVDQIDEESDSKEDENNENNKENNDNNNINNDDNNNDNKNDDLENKYSKKSLEEENKSEKDKKNISEKKVFFANKKKSNKYLCPLDNHKEQNIDFFQKKLMSQSKLINMYYEVKDKSPKSEHIIEPPKSKLIIENNNSSDKNLLNDNKDSNIIFVDNNDLDCKSEPGFLPYDQNNLSDNESSNDEKDEAMLKRVFTIIEDIPYNQNKDSDTNRETSKNSSRTKLGFIRSNFFNNFKI